MKLPGEKSWIFYNVMLFLIVVNCAFTQSPTTAYVKNFQDGKEAERLINAVKGVPTDRKIQFVSKYFLGRKYHPETKKRIKTGKIAKKVEATNTKPQSIDNIPTSFLYLDCMTYVEHVLALASSDRPSYTKAFLPRLVDIMYQATGEPLMNHHRNHFTSQWADVNEQKGYLQNIAKGHKLAARRKVVLNRVGKNRTFYVPDSFTIAKNPQNVDFFPIKVVIAKKAPLRPGDILAFACGKEGLDVTHMGFYIEEGKKKLLRHASSKKNRIMDEDFYSYLMAKKGLTGLMILRPILKAQAPSFSYKFASREKLRPSLLNLE